MSARNRLLDLYQHWRQWTHAEAEAIRAGAWPRVTHCQEAKHQLQKQILEATEQWAAEDDAGDPRPEVDPQVRRIVDELILLELRNSELVDERRNAARKEQAALDQSCRNLRHLQKAYAPSRQALWECYS